MVPVCKILRIIMVPMVNEYDSPQHGLSDSRLTAMLNGYAGLRSMQGIFLWRDWRCTVILDIRLIRESRRNLSEQRLVMYFAESELWRYCTIVRLQAKRASCDDSKNATYLEHQRQLCTASPQ